MIRWLTLSSRHRAAARRGWLSAHKWWLLRRCCQIAALAAFMSGPLAGYWIMRGNFASSEMLGVLGLSDPYILLQSAFAGWPVAAPALVGALLIGLFYLLVGGRVYCSFVCPVNIVTDTAHWLREKTGLTRDRKLDRRTRLWLLLGTLLAAALTGTIAWEYVNPVSMMQRGLIFGAGLGWSIVLLVFLLDLFVSRRAWCSHLCPVGAFYGLVGRFSLVRVSARNRDACDNCGACFSTCPEPHVIVPALKGEGSPLILSGDCINCGGCIDSCPNRVFAMASRLRP
ncbi:quinol dehydrogenase ferredoxin subunit NapH [Paracoccus denitrificans]|jgi:ferredoxin-type protein NapH|uniref:Methylamine utilization ferredoxin-type protein MauN n=1 Tax=Paracoccus denitrificans (strain Pd 1222) TaxID=318586 RepID=MAUN_PARDP|nr:quinol dehydrogenase ferredoxin subunit NapH [Paracoccus denitrificans]Q51660.1 RecName: Full=Methylamine utilization ferredoxin-type protein MauN [Paracoccus denitrificans PD1222]AAA86469.1 MauN [Paracoccus denitrificans PD1222]ABL72799.1 periplasmic nitrate reductase subunit NapH [Paracoccus denitrificans PD1222]MBB4626278.1 ferredoxin-type protein NapH [Paracoccus denitrificans]MCU7427517.1 quinol dehydrogenase ferredoxin subunit NapH [Paracoccus denitrificans]QAR29759.1 quinol dehydrog